MPGVFTLGIAPPRLDPEAAKPLKDQTTKRRLPLSRAPLPLLGSNQDSPDLEGHGN
jgi:hypothetical protein